jgi:hypothetical protein
MVIVLIFFVEANYSYTNFKVFAQILHMYKYTLYRSIS